MTQRRITCYHNDMKTKSGHRTSLVLFVAGLILSSIAYATSITPELSMYCATDCEIIDLEFDIATDIGGAS